MVVGAIAVVGLIALPFIVVHFADAEIADWKARCAMRGMELRSLDYFGHGHACVDRDGRLYQIPERRGP